ATGTQPGGGADVAQAGTLLQQASGEFAKQNYGGALYLANQTKSLTSASRSRLGGAGRPPLRPGEVSFAVPVRLRATVRSKVRGGPGAAYKVLFTVEPGAGLVGYSYVERWVRVGDESGRAALVSGIRTTNSSPPWRAAQSTSRVVSRRTPAMRLSASSPARCP